MEGIQCGSAGTRDLGLLAWWLARMRDRRDHGRAESVIVGRKETRGRLGSRKRIGSWDFPCWDACFKGFREVGTRAGEFFLLPFFRTGSGTQLGC